jgi:hypothetical protein
LLDTSSSPEEKAKLGKDKNQKKGKQAIGYSKTANPNNGWKLSCQNPQWRSSNVEGSRRRKKKKKKKKTEKKEEIFYYENE